MFVRKSVDRSGYRSLENHLYRVEIQNSGAPGAATYTWSRENRSIAAPWQDQQGNDTIVSSLGRDGDQSFAVGQWVEFIDDTHELQGLPGRFAQLAKVARQVLSLEPATATGQILHADFPSNPKVRRWDSPGPLVVTVPADDDDWLPLEAGVQIQFHGDFFNTGDYWLIPARTATGDVEWARDETQQPLAQAPEGIQHHYSRLALLTFDGTDWAVQEDCRSRFTPLSQPSIHITDVRTQNGPLRHNMPMSVDELKEGLQVEFDSDIDPETISQATCYVTVDLPISSQAEAPQWDQPVIGFQPLVVDAQPSAQGRQVDWTVNSTVQTWLTDVLSAIMNRAEINQVRARFTLKGHAIWSPMTRVCTWTARRSPPQ